MLRVPADRPPVVEGLHLLRLVGQGGEGEVWEAVDGEGRRRALKLVAPEYLATPVEAARRGAWLVRIDHPALVRVHRSGVLGWEESLSGWGFVEMDFVDGPSLADAPADARVLERLMPLAEALDLLHAGRWSDGVPLVHRDVKPANVVADRSGRLVLVDFSTLREFDGGEMTQVGTPVYAAPEAYSGGLGPASDVYSFAATVVALVTGQRGQALAATVRDPRGAGLPPILARALSADVRERPASCQLVLGDLARVHTLQLSSPPTRQQTRVLPQPEPWGEPARPGEPPARVQQPAQQAQRREWPRAEPAARQEPPQAPQAQAQRREWPRAEPAARQEPRQAPARAQRAQRREWPRPAGRPERAADQGPRQWGPPSATGRPPPAVLPWVAAGVLAFGLPAVAAVARLAPRELAAAGAAAILIHLVAQFAGNGSLLLSVLLPPIAWAVLLGDRAGGSRRRSGWARALLVPGCLVMGAATVLAVSTLPLMVRLLGRVATRLDGVERGGLNLADAVGLDPITVGVTGLVLTLLGVAAVRDTGAPGALLRTLTLPLWLVGVAVLFGLTVAALPFAPLAGRAGQLTGALWNSIAGVVEVGSAPGG